MTFDDVLKAVHEADELHHVVSHVGMTHFAESYRNDAVFFTLAMKHSAKGFRVGGPHFLVGFGPFGQHLPELVELTAEQFLTLREAINRNCRSWGTF